MDEHDDRQHGFHEFGESTDIDETFDAPSRVEEHTDFVDDSYFGNDFGNDFDNNFDNDFVQEQEQRNRRRRRSYRGE